MVEGNHCSRAPVVVVDDTGAILTGLPRRLPGKHYTVSSVVQEVRDRESRRILEEALELGRLEILDPPREALVEAERAARRTRVLSYLSRTDLEVLALALWLKRGCPLSRVLFATDDLRLADAARHGGLEIVNIRYRSRRARHRGPRRA